MKEGMAELNKHIVMQKGETHAVERTGKIIL